MLNQSAGRPGLPRPRRPDPQGDGGAAEPASGLGQPAGRARSPSRWPRSSSISRSSRRAGSIRTEKVGRVRTCSVAPGGPPARRAVDQRARDLVGAPPRPAGRRSSPSRTQKNDSRKGRRSHEQLHRSSTRPSSSSARIPHSAARVFAAFSDTATKRRWFAEGEGWQIDVVRRRLPRGRPARPAASVSRAGRRSPTTPSTRTSSPTGASCSCTR